MSTMVKENESPVMPVGMRTKGLTAGYLAPWPKDLPSPACASTDLDPECWFPSDLAEFRAAASVCASCRLADFCRQVASARGEYGVWGGILYEDGVPVDPAALG